MNVTIKDKQGNALLTVPAGIGSKRRFQLMTEDYVMLKFSLLQPVALSLGDGIDDPAIGLFELADPYKPAYNAATGGYDYELRLDAYYWKWKNKKFFYLPEEAGREAAWNLTATLDVHLGVFLRNLAALGYDYKGTPFSYSIDDTVERTAKLVSYKGTNLIDALNMMAETWECEWWVTDSVIHFGRCEYGDPVEFKLGANVNQMTPSDSQEEYITRMYVFGSDRNIPAYYRKKLVFTATEGGRYVTDSQRRLQLSYFPESARKAPLSLPASVRLSGTATGSQSAFSLTTGVLGDLPGGVYRFVPGNLYARLSTAFTSNIGNLSAAVRLEYSDGVAEKRLLVSSYEESGTPTVSTVAVFPESKFELPSNASGCKLSFEFSFTVSADSIRTSVDISGAASVECAARQADAVFTFVSGSKKGASYNAVFNPFLQEGDGANFLLLPEGVKADVGDQYTIDNLLKGKVPASYFTQDTEGLTVNGVVQTRLMLPEGTPYIDAYPGMTQEEAVEGIVVLDDIYPKRTGAMSDVHTRTETVKNDDGTEEEVTYYRYRDTGLEFSKDYIIPGKELHIIFQSGDMNGMEFGVIFNPDPKDDERGEQLWEIVRNEDYGRPLPDDVIFPSNGDTYILTGFDTSFVSDAYLPAAEQELLAEGQKRMEQNKKDPSTYDCEMNAVDIYNGGETVTYEPGDRVKLVNPAYFGTEGRQSRIIGYEWPLDIPYDHPHYIVGETAPYSRLGEIEGKINELTYKGNEYKGNATGSGKSVYVIGTNDNTKPTDRNVFSAKRAMQEFLSRLTDDTAAGIITFLKGLNSLGVSNFTEGINIGSSSSVDKEGKAKLSELLLKGLLTVGNYVSGKSGGKIGADGAAEFLSALIRGMVTASGIESPDFSTGVLGTGFTLKKDSNGDSYLEVDRMLVRKIATFVQLLIQKIRAVGGQIILSPASMNCSRVEEHDAFYRCFFENSDGDKTIAQEFVEGDQARCQTFNVKEGVNEGVTNTYYWRLVVSVGDNYIDLSKTDCDEGSTIPHAGDDIVQLGNRKDTTRQAAIILAAYGNDAPYIKMYRGIDSYSLTGKEFINLSRTEVMIIADTLRFSTGESVKDYIDNATGNSITGVDVEYALGDSPTVAPTPGWSTDSPVWTTGKYIWQRTKTTTSKGALYSSPVCIQGAKGEDGADGVPGKPGTDGKTLYTWIRYADTSTGEGISNDPTGKAFIGFAYNKETATESNIPSDYIWSEIKGEQGVPGVAGKDGKTLYTWIAYSDNANGTPMYQQPTSTTQYIGIATNKESAKESDNPSDYTWSKFKGDKGEQGDRGLQGIQGEKGEQGIPGVPGKDGSDGRTTYFHIKYSANANGNPMTETPNTYIGTYVDFTQEDSDDYTKYTWARFEGLQGKDGTDGIPGKDGEDGKTYYLHIKYSNDGGKTFTSNNGEDSGDYIGVLTDLTEADSSIPSNYKWSKIKGDKGEQGIQGLQGEQGKQGIPGTPGADGADGKTSYFHIKYSSVANPTSASQMTETPSDYIGTYVDYTESDSTDPSKYTWARFKGIQGEKGDQGIPGTSGLDGKTYYLHIAYANSADGSQGFSTTDSTNKIYIGQYTDTTQADSTDYKKYSWTKIKGEQGETGKGVSALEEQYYLSTSNTTQASGQWVTTCPAWQNGKYIWTRTKVTWTDNTVTYTTPVLAGDVNDINERLEEAIAELSENIQFTTSLSKDLETVKKQVDGAIETYFLDPVPTLSNEPASGWTTEEIKKQHLGDLYYDGNGKAYRFQKNSVGSYVWQVITDSDITLALANAKKAQDTADGKRRVFVTTPTNASVYDVGDLWVNATYGSYSNDLLRCKTSKAAGSAWSINHWEKASKYTDDTKANQAIQDAATAQSAANTAAGAAANAQKTADDATKRLNEWAADGYISPTEKQSISDEIARIDGDKSEIQANYTKYGLGTPTAFNNAYNSYRANLVTLSASTPESIPIPSNFKSNQTAYYTARTNALNAIADAAIKYAEDKANEAVSGLQIGGRNLILGTQKLSSPTIVSSKADKTDNGYGSFTVLHFNYIASQETSSYIDIVRWSNIQDNINEDTTYTLSFFCKGTGRILSYLYPSIISNGNNIDGNTTTSSDGRIITNLTEEWRRVWIKWTTKSTKPTGNLTLLPIRTESVDSEVWACGFKFEEGNVATGWTPAPEDVEDEIAEAMSTAQAAQTAAANADSKAQGAADRLSNWASDSYISPTEKLALKQEQKMIAAEKDSIAAEAAKYGVSSADYVSKWTAYDNELTYHTAATPENIAVRSAFSTSQAAYYTAYKSILESIATAAKKAATDIASDLESYKHTVDAKFEATNDSITAAVTSAKEFTTESINGIQVGERNLITRRHDISLTASDFPDRASMASLLNSKGQRETTITANVPSAAEPDYYANKYVFIQSNLSEPLVPDFYVFSFDYKTDSTAAYASLDWRRADQTLRLKASVHLKPTEGKWARGYAVCDWREATDAHVSNLLSAGFNTEYGTWEAGETVSIRNIKLVRGTKGWDDSEAPEDMESEFAAYKQATDTKLQVLDGQISLKVSTTELAQAKTEMLNSAAADATTKADNALASAKADATEKVNNLQIGGENILLNTKAFGTSTIVNGGLRGSATTQSETYRGLAVKGIASTNGAMQTLAEYGITEFDLGEEFTFSFYVKGSVQKINTYFYGATGYVGAKRIASSDGQAPSGSYSDGRTVLPVTEDWKRVWVTWQLNSTGDTSIKKYALIRTESETGKNIYVCGCKLERGNKATAWSPSSLDADLAIDTAKQDAITTAGANADKKYATITTVTNMQSSITTLQNSITAQSQKITTVETSLGSLTTRVTAAEAKITPEAIKLTVSETVENRRTVTLDASALDENTYYPVTIQLPIDYNPVTMLLYAHLNGVVPSWASHKRGFTVEIEWDDAANGWGTRPISRHVYAASFSWTINSNGVIPAGDIGQVNESSTAYVYVRGGGRYALTLTGNSGIQNCTVKLNTTKWTWTQGTTTKELPLKTSVAFPITDMNKRPTEEEVKAGITLDGFGVSVFGKKIDFTGRVTFSSLASDAQQKINEKAASASVSSAIAAAKQEALAAAASDAQQKADNALSAAIADAQQKADAAQQAAISAAATDAAKKYATAASAASAQTTADAAKQAAANAQSAADKAQGTASTAQSAASTAQSAASAAQQAADKAQSAASAASSSLSTLRNNLGDLAYSDLVGLAMLDQTIVEGGYLRTALVDAQALFADHAFLDRIQAIDIATGRLTVTDGGRVAGFVVDGESLRNADGMTASIGVQYTRSVAGKSTDFLAILGYQNPLAPDSTGTAGWFQTRGAGANVALRLIAQGSQQAVGGDTAAETPSEAANLAIVANGGVNWIMNEGDYWRMPGVLWCGHVNGSNGNLRMQWGNGMYVTGIERNTSISTGFYRVHHTLGSTRYFPIPAGQSNDTEVKVRVWNCTESYFDLITSRPDGQHVPADFFVAVFGPGKTSKL